MKDLNNSTATIIGLALLGGLVWIAYWLGGYALNLLGEVDPTVMTGTILGLILVVCVGVMLIGNRIGQQTFLRREAIRQHRSELYPLLFDVLAENSAAKDSTISDQVQQAQGHRQALERQLLLWGSRRVIEGYTAYQNETNSETAAMLWTQVTLGIREELGTDDELDQMCLTQLIKGSITGDPQLFTEPPAAPAPLDVETA